LLTATSSHKFIIIIIIIIFSPRMLQSVYTTFSSSGVGIVNSMQGILPATYPLLVLSLGIDDWLGVLGFTGEKLDCSLQVLRVLSLEAPKVGGSLDQRWCQSVGVLGYPAAVGDAEVPNSVPDGTDT
jgi:hypothetical protein